MSSRRFLKKVGISNAKGGFTNMELGSPLGNGAVGVVITMLATANAIQWREIRRLNAERLKDMQTIGEADRKVISGVITALNNLRRKIDGSNGDTRK